MNDKIHAASICHSNNYQNLNSIVINHFCRTQFSNFYPSQDPRPHPQSSPSKEKKKWQLIWIKQTLLVTVPNPCYDKNVLIPKNFQHDRRKYYCPLVINCKYILRYSFRGFGGVFALKTSYVTPLLLAEPLSVYSIPWGVDPGGRDDGNVLGEQRTDLHLQTKLIHNRWGFELVPIIITCLKRLETHFSQHKL